MKPKLESTQVNTAHTPTPGPWKVAPAIGTLCAWRIETDIPNRPCIAFVAQTIGDNQEENANAQLIASAPLLLSQRNALLEALENLVAFLDVPRPFGLNEQRKAELSTIQTTARNAITQAKV